MEPSALNEIPIWVRLTRLESLAPVCGVLNTERNWFWIVRRVASPSSGDWVPLLDLSKADSFAAVLCSVL